MVDDTFEVLTSSLRRFAETKADEDWQAVEEAMHARDAYHLRVSARRAVRYANHGTRRPPADPCESCNLAVETVLSDLASERPT